MTYLTNEWIDLFWYAVSEVRLGPDAAWQAVSTCYAYNTTHSLIHQLLLQPALPMICYKQLSKIRVIPVVESSVDNRQQIDANLQKDVMFIINKKTKTSVSLLLLRDFGTLFHWTVELLHPLTHLRSVLRHFSLIQHNRTVARASVLWRDINWLIDW